MHEDGWTPRQQEIIERTIDVLRQGGLSKLTMKKIAAAVGVSDAALYRHFPTKEALLQAVMEEVSCMLLGPIEVIAADPSLPAADRLEGVLRHHVEVLLATDSLPILILAEASAAGDEAVLERIRALLGRYGRILEGLCRELPRSATAPPPEQLAMLCMGLPAAVGLRHRVLPDPAAERRLVEGLIPFLVSSLMEGGR